MNQQIEIVAVVPAAGIGSRMKLSTPKQYLLINGQSILEHAVYRLLAHKSVARVVVVINRQDEYFVKTSLLGHAKIDIAYGGESRADSVLAGLQATKAQWVMVHDAARPCIRCADIDELINVSLHVIDGAILAIPARDTIKKAQGDSILSTLDRSVLWQALTPQMFKREQLIEALQSAKEKKLLVTDEASAIELLGGKPKLVQGRSDNIKVTLPEDLALASFFLNQNKE